MTVESIAPPTIGSLLTPAGPASGEAQPAAAPGAFAAVLQAIQAAAAGGRSLGIGLTGLGDPAQLFAGLPEADATDREALPGEQVDALLAGLLMAGLLSPGPTAPPALSVAGPAGDQLSLTGPVAGAPGLTAPAQLGAGAAGTGDLPAGEVAAAASAETAVTPQPLLAPAAAPAAAPGLPAATSATIADRGPGRAGVGWPATAQAIDGANADHSPAGPAQSGDARPAPAAPTTGVDALARPNAVVASGPAVGQSAQPASLNGPQSGPGGTGPGDHPGGPPTGADARGARVAGIAGNQAAASSGGSAPATRPAGVDHSSAAARPAEPAAPAASVDAAAAGLPGALAGHPAQTVEGAAPGTAREVDRAALVDQVVRQADLFTTPLGRGVELRLDPPELGTLVVRVVMEQGELAVHLRADSPEALSALRDSLPQLRDGLADRGLTAQRFSFDLTGGDAGPRRQFQPPQSSRRSRPGEDADSGRDPIGAVGPARLGSIDYRI